MNSREIALCLNVMRSFLVVKYPDETDEIVAVLAEVGRRMGVSMAELKATRPEFNSVIDQLALVEWERAAPVDADPAPESLR